MKNEQAPQQSKKIIIAGLLLICSTTLPFSGCSSIGKKLITNYRDPWHEKLETAGIHEKQADFNQVIFNYAEGPDNGPPLLLLNAQHMDWYSYSRVLPQLSEKFHIFAIDYQGHGKTVYPTDYTMNADQIGSDLAGFIESVIKEPAFITGNSSGGLLTVWLASNRPELVRAVVLEDPPLFSSEYPRIKQTISDRSFTTCTRFIEDGETDFLLYWLNSTLEIRSKSCRQRCAAEDYLCNRIIPGRESGRSRRNLLSSGNRKNACKGNGVL